MSAVTIPIHRLTPGRARSRQRELRSRRRERQILRELEQATDVTTAHERNTDMTTPKDRLIAAHAADPDPRASRRLRSLSETYKPDEQIEHLLRLRQEDPALFRTLATPTLRMTIGSYEAAKSAAKEVNK